MLQHPTQAGIISRLGLKLVVNEVELFCTDGKKRSGNAVGSFGWTGCKHLC